MRSTLNSYSTLFLTLISVFVWLARNTISTILMAEVLPRYASGLIFCLIQWSFGMIYHQRYPKRTLTRGCSRKERKVTRVAECGGWESMRISSSACECGTCVGVRLRPGPGRKRRGSVFISITRRFYNDNYNGVYINLTERRLRH
ncbi:hypothetical protein EVAR_25514_1 [Eumeta japonica]|uniref:Uncharacterized protein n=1 Tax=Eumeta variegata TaxID=151549 RepID=A0A4C1VMD9_EUMVA|nr:hypothetical protein EVAR_25514_1 [Eumeta japonica]